MFAKLFSRITESSIMEEDVAVRYVFVMMLAIADPQGYVIGTDVAIARRINVNLRMFSKCLHRLKSPDPNSNSPEEEGRRIIDSDGERGYKLVNYIKYRSMRDEEDRREYQRTYRKKYREEGRDKNRPVIPVNNGQHGQPQSTQAEAEATAEEEEESARAFAHSPSEKEFVSRCAQYFIPEWYAVDKFHLKNETGWGKGDWRSFVTRVKGWYENDGKPTSPQKKSNSINGHKKPSDYMG